MVVCPFTVQQYGSAVECHGSYCRMWHKNDCVIRSGLIAFVECMDVLSAKTDGGNSV
jgi:hypothetical protein